MRLQYKKQNGAGRRQGQHEHQCI